MDYILSLIERLLAPFLTSASSNEVNEPQLQVEEDTTPTTQLQINKEEVRMARIKAEIEARKELGLPSFQERGEQRLKQEKALRDMSERIEKLLRGEIVEDDDDHEDDDVR
jgi:hypothetical protein